MIECTWFSKGLHRNVLAIDGSKSKGILPFVQKLGRFLLPFFFCLRENDALLMKLIPDCLTNSRNHFAQGAFGYPEQIFKDWKGCCSCQKTKGGLKTKSWRNASAHGGVLFGNSVIQSENRCKVLWMYGSKWASKQPYFMHHNENKNWGRRKADWY